MDADKGGALELRTAFESTTGFVMTPEEAREALDAAATADEIDEAAAVLARRIVAKQRRLQS